MKTQRNSLSWGCWSLLLLVVGLAMPPATGQALSYQQAVLLAVQGFNQRSSEANLYRLLELGAKPEGDENPNTPKPVSFTVKETVCPRTTRQPPEECDFKENGLIKECIGTVDLDPAKGYFDITCDQLKDVSLGGLLKKGGQIIGKKIEKIGKRIKDFFTNTESMEEAKSV
ncbi:cathelicidin antimicrobial peptide [Molossus molossus]|uniref:Cathelicidin antimicrobial peptide n=1 Tax=Molossus molossus TaxID=27622 RepID=A0A7J8DA39_MOLMO|nr:cathelicidin antimicrobial peptide [Molossus molossus]KAF6420041.1 cathelicidin antimicrobial peptide [Molossus molossus]